MQATIRDLRDDVDAAAFRSLNQAWIAEHFDLEDEDRRQLADPVASYIGRGGDILIADVDGDVAGCVAIVPDGHGAFELSKMAVRPALQGQGLGHLLIEAAVERARGRGARSVYLGSSTKLHAAVHLYEAHGFEHVPRESLHMPFARATVFMRRVL